MGLIWGAVISVVGVVGAILISVTARIISEDIKEWLPWITHCLIERAVDRLPESERQRLEEEWRSHVNELPGSLTKIYTAYGYLSASRSINEIVRTAVNQVFFEKIQELTRRVVDILLSVMLLIFFFPSLIFVPICIELETRGPVFFVQRRIGRNGRAVYVQKIRTEHIDLADSPGLNNGTDSRITRVGRFLRGTSLDEIPQLINVLQGDMHLIFRRKR